MPEAESAYPLHFPVLYFPVLIVLGVLLIETWFKRRQPWSLPAAVVYATIAVWYFADLVITPEDYNFIPDSLLNTSYCQVALFLITYRLLTHWLTKKFIRNARTVLQHSRPLAPETLFGAAVVLWVVLVGISVTTMNGDLLGALFPLDARMGNTMWARAGGSDAGATGFLISTGGYVYALTCASFGIWLFFVRTRVAWFAAIGMVALSWPSFLLSGTRNGFLAVSMPFFFAYLLFGRQRLWFRIVCLVVGFVLVDSALRVVITYRNIGFKSFLYSDSSQDKPEVLSRHQGLNMIQELCYTNLYTESHPPYYGAIYLQELVSIIPRAIWPSKPMLSINYAVARGFGGANNDIGVDATVSSGMIGGGVLNFGPWFGPFAPALLMAVWTALLARWWVQRASLLRCLLFLAGLGLTFNLGRDITLLVLWPVVFGYVIVRIVEKCTRRTGGPKRRAARVEEKKDDPIVIQGGNVPMK